MFGTEQGEVLVYDFVKKKGVWKQAFPGEVVKEILIEGEVVYVLTNENLYLVTEDPDFEDLYQAEVLV